jgi:hypothetical protein
MPESRLSAKSYLLVAAELLALTALTSAAAMLDLGSWNTVIALAILMVGRSTTSSRAAGCRARTMRCSSVPAGLEYNESPTWKLGLRRFQPQLLDVSPAEKAEALTLLALYRYTARTGRDVLSTNAAEKANQRIPDSAVLELATWLERALLTIHHGKFIQLHTAHLNHTGIIR